MAKSKLNEKNVNDLTGCYGLPVSYAQIKDFLGDNFELNNDAQKYGMPRFATCIWGLSGTGKCVGGDTYVHTSLGIVKIRDLFDNIKTEGFYPSKGLKVFTSNTLKDVDYLYYDGLKQTFKLILEDNTELVCSEIHPIKIITEKGLEFKMAKDLSIEDYVAVLLDKHEDYDIEDVELPPVVFDKPQQFRDFFVPRKMTKELAYILGTVVSEGCFHNGNIRVTQENDKKIIKQYIAYVKQTFGLDVTSIKDKRRSKLFSYDIYRTALINWMKNIGVLDVPSCNKEVPWSVLRSSKDSQRNFLMAFFEGECNTAKGGLELSSASKKLVEQIKLMLLGFGIFSNICKKIINGECYYVLHIYGRYAQKLNKLINFSRARGSWIDNKIYNPNKEGFPIKWIWNFLREMKASHLENGGIITKKQCHSNPLNQIYANLTKCRKVMGVDTVYKIAKFFKKADSYYWRILGEYQKYHFVKIKDIKKNGIQELYDLTVSDEHEFLANGICVHNTSLVKQFADNPLEWNGKKYDGYKVSHVPIAQFEEMGDLHGIPMDCVHMKLKGNGKEKWVPQKDEVIRAYRENGWEIDDLAPRMMYAPPPWVPDKPGPSILLLDDWNRASIRIIKGIMQLLQDYGMVSWDLPEGCNIVLTGNPDEQDYLVTTIDQAILTRIKHVTLQPDAKEWAVWAEKNELDKRLISWCLYQPEMMIGRERTNPRTLAEFGRYMKRVKSVEAERDKVLIHAHGLLDEDTITAFIIFCTRDMEDVIEPEEILKGKIKEIKERVKKLMDRDEPRTDILGVICARLYAYMIQEKCVPEPEIVSNFQSFITDENVPQDIRHALCQRLVLNNNTNHKWVMGNKDLKDQILAMLR